ncbi:MAG: malonate decarboxylase holo-[acyl-carrier-protein] synthase [Azoarcus sp.]|nr:malonate decarboxylase holo-[acyl-carrier-protein] synthase [Azoarcus sp.]
MPERPLERHDLVWLAPAAVSAAQPSGPCCAADPEASRLLANWVGAGHPLIVARQNGTVGAGWVRLGLALPPMLGKRRLAFLVARHAIVRSTPPPALSASVLGALPAQWRPLLSAVLALPALQAAAPRFYGSAAMQFTTGLNCLGVDSDLDLLLSPPDWLAARAACRALDALDDPRCPPRLDGEIRNAAGDAVAWRELAADSRQVLVKSLDDVRLVARAAFADGFLAPTGVAA